MSYQTLHKLFSRDLAKLKEEISLYSDDTSLWKKIPGTTNSGGNLALHLAGNLRHFIGATLGNTAYVRNRDLEFSTRNLSRHELSKLVELCILEVGNTFQSSDIISFDSMYPAEFLGEKLSVEYVLLHLLAHLNYHLGQINYHRRYFNAVADEL